MGIADYEKKVSKVLSRDGLYSNYFDGKNRAEKPCGYCHYVQHRGFISHDLLKSHECMEKNCPHFSKYCDSPLFVDRRYKSLEKKLKKDGSPYKIEIVCGSCGRVATLGKESAVDFVHRLKGAGWSIGYEDSICRECKKAKKSEREEEQS